MKIVMLLLLSLFMFGCTTAPIQIIAAPTDRIPLVLPEVDRYYSREIKWIVITPKNAEKVFAKIKKEGKPVAIIGLTGGTDGGYKSLTLNTADTQLLIKQLITQLNAYKKYYIAVEQKEDRIKKQATDEKLKKDAVTVKEEVKKKPKIRRRK